MKIESDFFSRKGMKENNEDAILPAVQINNVWWSAIADGMGGKPGGGVASRAVIESIKSSVSEGRDEFGQLFEAARMELQRIADRELGLSGMGTTLSVLRLENGVAKVGHVGDTRIYHLRGDGILNRTIDQTEVEELVRQGVLSKADARKYPRRNILLSVLSPGRAYELYQDQFDVQDGDRLLLLTDGVSSKVLRKEIRDLSMASRSPKELCASLISKIEGRQPEDDYSAVCVDLKP